MEQLKNLWSKYRELIAYLFFGILTVVVNTAAFQILSETAMGILWGNTVAFFIAVAFAYWTNTKFVFRTNFTWSNCFQFWGMRIGTLVIDNVGIVFLVGIGVDKLISKVLINVIIIVINYICSKLFVYKKQ